MAEDPADFRSELLESWKEIATYLRRDVRTVQRWEKEEGLPVHRHPHKQRDTVYAYQTELDAWKLDRGMGPALEPPLPKPRTGRLVLAAAAGLTLGASVWFGVVQRTETRASEMKTVPLTSYPGTEAWPSFSPDGNQVAFAWKREGHDDFDIYVKGVGSDSALQLTRGPEWDTHPAWSPTGGEIAFYRSGREGGLSIFVVSPFGGPERLLVELGGRGAAFWPNPRRLDGQLSWSPDGTWLAHDGIWLLSAKNGDRKRLTSSPTWLADVFPSFSPDGQWLAFVRRELHSANDIFIVPRAGGEPRRLTTDAREILGLGWTADGREIVFSSDRGGEPGLWRVAASGGAPRRVAEAGAPASLPSTSRQGGRLAFTRQFHDANIWRVDAAAAGSAPKAPVRVIASTKHDGAPQLSPDGHRIAFTSNRSGASQVWLCDRDGSNAFALTSGALGSWSPDGKSIAFNAGARGNVDIYVISVAGGAPRQLTAEDSADATPSWSWDGRWVYFWSNRTGRAEVWKVPASGGPAIQLTRHGGHRPAESPDGRFVYYHKSPKIYDAWRVPVEGGEETPVLEHLRSRWALANDGLYLFEQEQDQRWFLKFFDFSKGRKKVRGRTRWSAGDRPASHRLT